MFVFDFEVLKYDWLVVIKDVNTNKYYKIHNSKNELSKIFEENKDKLWFSYNGNHYDYPIFS